MVSSYIENVYNFDRQSEVRMAPKLTDKHIKLPPFAPLQVKLAAQVLSHSVTAGVSFLVQLSVPPEEAKDTVLFLE